MLSLLLHKSLYYSDYSAKEIDFKNAYFFNDAETIIGFFGRNKFAVKSKLQYERKSVIIRTPCRQSDREGCGTSVRAVARFSRSLFPLSLSLSSLSPFLAISPSQKGDDELAREGRRKRVNQAECVPEREQAVGGTRTGRRVENPATGVTSVSICMPT